jgi:uracil-DNA glycosylase
MSKGNGGDIHPQIGLTADAPRDCELCPRLAGLRAVNRNAEPDWFNGAVPSFGDPNAQLVIVGLAPGLRGANRTGRPFTGDYAGDLLYATLLKLGLAYGTYDRRADDGLRLTGCVITNAVRCVPPENKPSTDEIKRCNDFLAATLGGLKQARVVLALGRVAHDAVLRALGLKQSAFAFGHGTEHRLNQHLTLIDCYHCSRYNTNTGKLTTQMFKAAVALAKARAGLA